MTNAVKVKRRRGFTKVSAKNQVTLPVDVLAAAHLNPGDSLKVEADGEGRVVLVREADPWYTAIGSVPGLSAATNLQALRDEWER